MSWGLQVAVDRGGPAFNSCLPNPTRAKLAGMASASEGRPDRLRALSGSQCWTISQNPSVSTWEVRSARLGTRRPLKRGSGSESAKFGKGRPCSEQFDSLTPAGLDGGAGRLYQRRGKFKSCTLPPLSHCTSPLASTCLPSRH